jgi:hypothetical protein
MRPRSLILFLGVAAVCGCRNTDHSERSPDEVTSEVINVPTSGFQEEDTARMPRFAFDSTTLDMGRVSQGARITKVFRFTNAGGSPLVITDVRGSCGCTVGRDWPKDPVAPGASGAITVSFDSEGRNGVQDKSVSVRANTRPPTTVLRLRGEVIAPPGSLPTE